jgi:small redox-active disulfide protein 2
MVLSPAYKTWNMRKGSQFLRNWKGDRRMNIKILGPGCARCHQLEKTTKEVVKELGIDATIEEVKDMMKIVQYPILTTPGLVINEELVCAGRVPTKAEVTQLMANALTKEDKAKG